MSESGKFMVMFNDKQSYEKYKAEVISSGGTIVNDLGSPFMGFTAIIPPTLLALMSAPSLSDNGISSIEADSVVTIQ